MVFKGQKHAKQPKPQYIKPMVVIANGERIFSCEYSKKAYQRLSRAFVLRRVANEQYEILAVRTAPKFKPTTFTTFVSM